MKEIVEFFRFACALYIGAEMIQVARRFFGDALFEDELARARRDRIWNGSGYIVRRRGDGLRALLAALDAIQGGDGIDEGGEASSS